MKKHILFLGIVFILLLLVSSLPLLHISQIQYSHTHGEELFAQVHNLLDGFPGSANGLGYTKLYYNDGDNEYMLLQNGERRIAGIRSNDQVPVFFADGESWAINEDGAQSNFQHSSDPVSPMLESVLSSLLNDSSISYTHHVAKGSPLPLWVYPDEHYIQCKRDAFPMNTEVMVCDTAEYGDYISWNIIGPDGDVILFLFTRPYLEEPNTAMADNLFGWGLIEKEVYSCVFE